MSLPENPDLTVDRLLPLTPTDRSRQLLYHLKQWDYSAVKLMLRSGVSFNLRLADGQYLEEVVYRLPDENELTVIWYLFQEKISPHALQLTKNPGISLSFILKTLDSFKWDWYSISEGLKLKDIDFNNPKCKLDFKALLFNPNMTIGFVEEKLLSTLNRDHQGRCPTISELLKLYPVVARTFNFTIEEGVRYLDMFDLIYLLQNTGITSVFFETHLLKRVLCLEWKDRFAAYDIIALAPYLNLNIYRTLLEPELSDHPCYSIICATLAGNKGLPIDWVLDQPHLNQCWYIITSRGDFSIEHLKKFQFALRRKVRFNSSNYEGISFEDIRNNLGLFDWNFCYLSRRDDLDPQFVIDNLESFNSINQAIFELCSNPRITIKFIWNNLHRISWNVNRVFQNPNHTVGSVLMLLNEFGKRQIGRNRLDPEKWPECLASNLSVNHPIIREKIIKRNKELKVVAQTELGGVLHRGIPELINQFIS